MKNTEQHVAVVKFRCTVKGSSYFWVCEWNPKLWPFKLNESFLTEQYFPVVLFLMLHKVVLNFESVITKQY